MSARPARVVAELGRPETPEEAEARTAENRRLRRSRQTARNLVYSLIACMAVVAVVVLLVPRGAPPATPPVDYRSLAAQTAGSVSEPLLAPPVPSSWRANAAELRTSGGVTSWYVGFVTDQQTYLGYSEGLNANPTWLASLLDAAPGSGAVSLGGLRWRVYDQRNEGTDAGNVAYALATRIGDTYLAVYGTATPAAARRLATGLATQAHDRGITGRNSAP